MKTAVSVDDTTPNLLRKLLIIKGFVSWMKSSHKKGVFGRTSNDVSIKLCNVLGALAKTMTDIS